MHSKTAIRLAWAIGTRGATVRQSGEREAAKYIASAAHAIPNE